MDIKEFRKNVVAELCGDVINKQKSAILAMSIDMEQTFQESKEEIVIFDKSHCGFLGVSYIGGKLRFIKEDGTAPLASAFNKSADFDTFCCVWDAFHNNLN